MRAGAAALHRERVKIRVRILSHGRGDGRVRPLYALYTGTRILSRVLFYRSSIEHIENVQVCRIVLETSKTRAVVYNVRIHIIMHCEIPIFLVERREKCLLFVSMGFRPSNFVQTT